MINQGLLIVKTCTKSKQGSFDMGLAKKNNLGHNLQSDRVHDNDRSGLVVCAQKTNTFAHRSHPARSLQHIQRAGALLSRLYHGRQDTQSQVLVHSDYHGTHIHQERHLSAHHTRARLALEQRTVQQSESNRRGRVA